MKVNVEFEFEDVTTEKHLEHAKKAPKQLLKGSIIVVGGCYGWIEGTTAYWISKSGRKYMHLNVAWLAGDCVSNNVYFFHIGGVLGGNYWHCCP